MIAATNRISAGINATRHELAPVSTTLDPGRGQTKMVHGAASALDECADALKITLT